MKSEFLTERQAIFYLVACLIFINIFSMNSRITKRIEKHSCRMADFSRADRLSKELELRRHDFFRKQTGESVAFDRV